MGDVVLMSLALYLFRQIYGVNVDPERYPEEWAQVQDAVQTQYGELS